MKLMRLFCILVASLVPAAALTPSPAAAQDLPTFTEVEKLVDIIFAQEKDYVPGDLISRKQVGKVLDAVEGLGWKLKDRRALEQRALDDGSFLVVQLRTKNGTKFMRQVATM